MPCLYLALLVTQWNARVFVGDLLFNFLTVLANCNQVIVKVFNRSSSLAFFPAYHFNYTYGVKYTPSRAEIIPQHFEALVGGTQGGRVAAELHLSSGKAQVSRVTETERKEP